MPAITHAVLVDGIVYGVGDSVHAALADAERAGGAELVGDEQVREVTPALAAAMARADGSVFADASYRLVDGRLATREEAEVADTVREAAVEAREAAIEAAMVEVDRPAERREMLAAMWDALQKDHPAVHLSRRRGGLAWAPGVPLLRDGDRAVGAGLARDRRAAAAEMQANLGRGQWLARIDAELRAASEAHHRDLAAIGAALYGTEWISPLSRALDVNIRTAQRWASGETPVPAGVAAEAHALLRRDGPGRLAQLRAKVDALAKLFGRGIA